MTEDELEIYIDYIITHRTDDFPMDETLDDFKRKAKKWEEQKNEITKLAI